MSADWPSNSFSSYPRSCKAAWLTVCMVPVGVTTIRVSIMERITLSTYFLDTVVFNSCSVMLLKHWANSPNSSWLETGTAVVRSP